MEKAFRAVNEKWGRSAEYSEAVEGDRGEDRVRDGEELNEGAGVIKKPAK